MQSVALTSERMIRKLFDSLLQTVAALLGGTRYETYELEPAAQGRA